MSWLTDFFRPRRTSHLPRSDEKRTEVIAAPEDDSATNSLDDDSPIKTAAQDRFGVDAFAGIVARALAAQGGAEGTVVALNGPWGSGKSSAVNLVLNHLRLIGRNSIEVISFNPWWFSGSDQLARAFLGEIATAMGRTIRDDGVDALRDIAARLTKLDTYLDAARKAGDQGVASGVASLLFESRSVEDDHTRLSEALRASGKRFVIVIDDIDRLNPDEALQMFQLVKSVGRLPYVTYLLAFDRLLIQRLLEERYPSEGGRYLEKVLQATFDLPEPSKATLREMALQSIGKLADVPESEMVRFMNVFEDVVVPRLTTPRQAIRYLGSLRITWPAVVDDVDPADFIAIEAVRVFEPNLYHMIRSNGPLVRGEDHGSHESREDWEKRADDILLSVVPESWRSWAKQALQRIFPRLEGAWSNMSYGSDWYRQWDLQRLICTKSHFPTYFSYAVPAETLTEAERRALIAAAGNPEETRALLLEGLKTPRTDGGTRAALMLDGISLLQDRISLEDVPSLLEGLFGIADDLSVDDDASRGFSIADNPLRLHWLLNAQVRDRFPFEERGPLLEQALRAAQISWRVDCADRMAKDHDPPEEGERRKGKPFMEEATARRIQAEALSDLLAAAEDGRLLSSNRANRLLWRLASLPDGPELARKLTSDLLATDEGVVKLAAMVTSTSWSQGMGLAGMGDRVARGSPTVHPDTLDRIVDADRLFLRANELDQKGALSEADKHTITWFLRGWQMAEQEKDE